MVHLFIRDRNGEEAIDHVLTPRIHTPSLYNPYIGAGHPYLEDENVKRSGMPYTETQLPYMGEHHDMGDERPYINTLHPYLETEHPDMGNGGDKRKVGEGRFKESIEQTICS